MGSVVLPTGADIKIALREAKKGHRVVCIALRCGVTGHTFNSWLADGEIQLRQFEEGNCSKQDLDERAALYLAVGKGTHIFEEKMLAVLRDVATAKGDKYQMQDWRCAISLLTLRFPELRQDRTRVPLDVSPNSGGAAAASVRFLEVPEELAALPDPNN